MAAELTYIVIPVHSRGEYDTREYLRNLSETLEANTSNYRLIFVDDNCDEAGSACIREIASRHNSSYVVSTFKQRWFTRAINLGLRLVRSPWAITLNSDCVLGEGWLEELYAIRDECGLGGRKVGLVGSVLSEEEPRRYSETSSPGFVTGHCWLLNMQAIFEYSSSRGMPGWYLDEQKKECIHIYSDNELCYGLNRLGYVTAQSFKSAVGHVAGKSWGHNLSRVFALSLDQVND